MLQALSVARKRIPIPKFPPRPAIYSICSATSSLKAKQIIHCWSFRKQQLQLHDHRIHGNHIPRTSLLARRTYSTGQTSSGTYYVQRKWHVWFDRLCLVALVCMGGWVAKRVMLMYIGLRGMLMWPEDVREDVAEFLLYLAEQDLDKAGVALQSAIFAVLRRPVAELGSNPHLKVTGLLVLYARILENNDKGAFAYKVYNTAWEYLCEMRKRGPLTEPELIRMMAIAAKLGLLSDDAEVEMKWMSWAVDECRKWKQSRNDEGFDDGSNSVAALEAANREYYEDVRLSPELRPSTQLGFPRDHWNMDTIMFYHYFPQPQWDVEANPRIVFFLMGRIHERQKHPAQALSYYFEALDEPDPCPAQGGKELALTETVAKVVRKHPIAFGHTKIIAQSITDCTTSILEDWASAGGQDLPLGTTLEDTIEKLKYSMGVITSFAIVCFACTKSHDKQRVRKMMLLLKKLLDANREPVNLFKSKVLKEIKEMEKAIKPVLED